MKVREVNVDEVQRHFLHKKLNRKRTTEELVAHAESITKHGRQKPIVVKMEEVNGQLIPMVVDGWSTVLVARQQGIETLHATELAECKDDELCDLVVDVQTNHHSDIEEDYKRFKYYRKMLSKGQGFRADLFDEDLNEWNHDDEEE